ncbi:hypothetical protein KKG31_07715 [Patescibacteria group bacterium]|nr:hypothetical protein [Patescibacteria group bacterium]MBU1758952.1 hypothetical protein [Patescibacteria group bacterium]
MDCAYECARGLSKCDDSMAKFTENMSKIGTQFGSGSKDARDKIVTSSKRLKTAFFGA